MSLESVFITGANRGLGLQFVRYIVSQPGHTPNFLFAACRDPSQAAELQQLAKQHTCVKLITLDITKDSDIDSAFRQTASCLEGRGLNLLINNAGVFDQTPCSLRDGVSRGQMQSHFNVNATGPALMTCKFLPLLRQAAERNSSDPMSYRRAAVINLSTVMASIQSSLSKGRCNSFHYRSSKAALNMLTALMSVELKQDGILVAAIHPGWTQTDMGGASADLDPETSVRNLWSAIAGMTEKSSGLLHNYDGTSLPW